MTNEQDARKKRVAEAALRWVQRDSIIGVGTGSTVNFFIDALAALANRIQVVASSEASGNRLRSLGIQVLDLNAVKNLSLYVDGADETTRQRQLIKGGGAALTREKIVAAVAKTFVCIVDDSKLVDVLGRFPLPVEVIPMARAYVARELAQAGGTPVWRENVVTDNGNVILDVHDLRITDPVAMETQLNQIAGVVTVGLFACRPADVLLVATGTDIMTL